MAKSITFAQKSYRTFIPGQQLESKNSAILDIVDQHSQIASSKNRTKSQDLYVPTFLIPPAPGPGQQTCISFVYQAGIVLIESYHFLPEFISPTDFPGLKLVNNCHCITANKILAIPCTVI